MSERYQFLEELIAEASGQSKVLNFGDPTLEKRRHEIEQSLPVTDPRHPEGFEVNRITRIVTFWWGGYRYEIPFDDIGTPLQLISWLHHFGEKTWRGFSGRRVRRLIEVLAEEFDWGLYQGCNGRTPRGTPADMERAKLTPRLRWKVLKRDGFKCRACGSGAAQGAILHIDHVISIAHGGRTETANLQALCMACNQGKGARH